MWHAVVRSFPTNKLLEDAQLLVGWPVAAARDAGDYLDPADIVVGHEHVLKHRLEPLMVMLDCPVEMGGSSVWPSNDFPSKASLGQLHLYSYRKQIPSRSPMLNRHSFLTTCLLSRLNSISRTPPMGLDPECIAGVRARAPGLSTREVIWGADYDAVLIAAAPPLPTILVPCEGGPSHNPAEATVPKECSAEAQVLLEAVLDYHRRRAERREEVAA